MVNQNENRIRWHIRQANTTYGGKIACINFTGSCYYNRLLTYTIHNICLLARQRVAIASNGETALAMSNFVYSGFIKKRGVRGRGGLHHFYRPKQAGCGLITSQGLKVKGRIMAFITYLSFGRI